MVLGNVGGFLVKTLASHNRCHNRLHNRYRLFESSVPLGIGIIGRKWYRYSYLEACCHFSGYKGLRKVLRAAVVPSRFPGIGIIGRKWYRYSYLEACCHFSGYKGLRKVLRAAVVPSRFPWTPQPSVLALSKTTRRNKKGVLKNDSLIAIIKNYKNACHKQWSNNIT